MITNRTGIADVLGVSLHTVDARVRRGMPYRQKADPATQTQWEFETADVINWMVQQAKEEAPTISVDMTGSPKDTQKELLTRKLTAETEIAELELAKKKGLVVFIDDALAVTSNAVAILRQRFLTLPRRIAPLILGETDEDTAKHLIEREVNDVLEELASNVQFTTDSLPEGIDEGDPPTY